ncbi:cellulose binding domain-containing protein [Streptomyces atacamensis]|uniref:cellulose binding domain-containing protein n=1 Tax=Streptomyces atacamensis TaxID=531966 RepID=UPI00399D0031
MPGRRSAGAALAALALAGGLLTASADPASAGPEARGQGVEVSADSYTWKNVRIDGGGFVPGIVFNPSEKDLVYARTDIGGAYRWDEAGKRWTPLLDSVGWDKWGHTGVASLATDPVDPDNVYVAVGNYTNDWDPDNGAVMRSSDRGATWRTTELPFKLGGNMPGRGMGERLAVDPNDNRVLYLGAPSGHGLWRSTDSGATWSEVESFPNPGTYVPDPESDNSYLTDEVGVVWVTFDERTGSAGNRTRTVYVGVADKEESVYRSTDGGTTWEAVPGQPTGYLPHKGVLDTDGGHLYIATSDTGGPYDGGKGQVWRYDTGSGEWTDVSPVPEADTYFGYSGLTVDRQAPGTLMVTGYSSWWPDTQIFRSTDSGETWTRAWEYDGYPNRSDRFTMDVSSVPWLTFGGNPSPPETAPKLGWMTESLEIDPFDSDRMMYGTGATVYGTEELTAWDRDETFTVKPMVEGLEETAVNDLISPPSGAPLLSGLGDIGGFRHTDLERVPELMYQSPFMGNVSSLDYAEKNPNTVVRVGSSDDPDTGSAGNIAFSTDNGANWFAGSSRPSGVTGGGTVAAAADASGFVWSPQGAGVHHTTGYGSSWSASRGIPAGARVEADRVDADTFYGFLDGTFYVSGDGGATFTASGATGLPAEGNVRFKAVPGKEGHIWLAGGSGDTYGLWRSTDGGESFARVEGVEEADTIGFGKAAPGASHPALYSSAKIGGVRGIYRSDDAGASWVRINDDAHQWGWTGADITGDPRVYGRVYVSTNGRGILYGDSPGTTDPTDPEDPEDPEDPGTARCAVAYKVTNQWQGGFQADVTVRNTGTTALDGWKAVWSFADGQRVGQMWNASFTQSGATVTASSVGWNARLEPGASASFGFTGSWSGSNGAPAAFELNGAACATG